MAISASDVMALRKRTGLGMMECKKALTETDGDVDAAIEMLREKLKGKMEERSGRETAQGVIAVAKADNAIALLELDTETDFVSRNEEFIAAADKLANLAVQCNAGAIEPTDEMKAIVDELRITTKENVKLRRAHKFEGGTLGSYVHHNNMVGVIIQAEGEIEDDLLTGICQHIAAHVPTPMAVDEAGLPADQLEEQKQDAVKEAQASGKPAEIAEKIATGKIRKWVDENTLLGQKYVKDMTGKTSVGQTLPKGASIKNFVRFAISE